MPLRALTSALGQKRTSRLNGVTSALPLKADIGRRLAHVGFIRNLMSPRPNAANDPLPPVRLSRFLISFDCFQRCRLSIPRASSGE